MTVKPLILLQYDCCDTNEMQSRLSQFQKDGDSILLPKYDLKRFLDLELKTPQLIDRTILITEDPNEHLVWLESRNFIKPLPEYLLDFDFWSACGPHLSYASWFIQDFLTRVNPETLELVHDRYKFVKLRLRRLNTLYRVTNLSLDNFVRGYMPSSTWYKAFFSRNFVWLLAAFVYVTVIISALQVGLATERLQESREFQEASYGFTIAPIIAVMGTAAVILSVWLVLFGYHSLSTWKY
ncbi:hypothetical protein B0O99DRAFT_662830 [Bisporella sp. PMI_857]|nr:hypothetical protein B0O99DRAFT_662830 [Bisporella sp. PMI_857]